MSALEFLAALTQLIYVLIFVVSLLRAVRRPAPANVDIALLFGATTYIILQQRAATVFGAPLPPLLAALGTAIAMALPYLLLRLYDDFAGVGTVHKRLVGGGLATIALLVALVPAPYPPPVTVGLVLYFFAVSTDAAHLFIRQAGRSQGLTRRRMQSVSVGAILLGLDVLSAAGALLPTVELRAVASGLGSILGLGSAVAFLLGFAPPPVLRKAWQEPELRAFLGRAARLPRLPTTEAIVGELERGAAAATGARATIGLWDPDHGRIRYRQADGGLFDAPADALVGGRAFSTDQVIFTANAERSDPANAALYRARGARAVICAPIRTSERRLGVLAVFAARAPIFASDDIELVGLLADQAAVILESRALIDEATAVRAREEATRLKDDFLSAAAHDLKTPLTTIVNQAQLLERRAVRDPQSPPDLIGLRRLVSEAKRLSALVIELLDASRLETGRLVGDPEPTDLVQLTREVIERRADGRHEVRFDGDAAVIADVDPKRFTQLVENLLENAKKYSPSGGEIGISVRSTGDAVAVVVRDTGIGIPAADLPYIFDRFHRGGNVDDRGFPGMGLGLYICRAIAQEHGGTITATSTPGQGSVFTVTLPRRPAAPAETPGGARDGAPG